MPMREIRLTVRSLARTPLFTLTAVLSLALGIGATTAIFSMLNQVLLRTLPVKEPAELAFLYHPGPVQGSSSTSEQGGPAFSYPMFREMQVQQTAFSGLAGAYSVAASVAYNNNASTGSALLVSGNYFQVLGVGAAIGRVFDENDDREPGGHPLVVISHAYWTSRFGADRGMLNRTMVVNGRGMTIVGVAQKGFSSEKPGSAPEIFVPITMKKEMTPDWDGLKDRKDYWVTLFGRLKPGTTLEQATTSINATYQPQLQQDIALLSNPKPETLQRYRTKKIELKPGTYGRGQLREQGRKPLLLLLAMTFLVLLIACANVANLQLTRALARSRETAVRLALGASRWQLAGRLLLESGVVAVAGAVLGLVVAQWTLRGILAALPPRTVGPDILTSSLDPRMLGFALGLAIITSLVFGLYPAMQASRAQLTSALRDQSGQTTASRSTGFFRKGLVTLQTAVSLLLLVSAGLFGKTLLNLSSVNLGIRPDHLMVFMLNPKLSGYDDARCVQLYEQLIERLGAVPGVITATSARVPAIAGSNSSTNMTVEGFTPRGDDDANSSLNEVGPGYFRTMGIPLIAGREFGENDRAGAPKVAIVNEAFVRHFIGNRNPIGVQLMRGSDTRIKYDTTIVGVAKDAHYSSLRDPTPPVYYTPYAQIQRQRSLYFYVRTAIDPAQMASAIRGAVASLDPNLPIVNLRTMQAQLDANMANERLLSLLTGAFAGLATLLAAIGLYGVLAFNVARRTREIGIRMALGAGAAQVRGLVVREVAVIIVVGLAAGLGGAYAAGALIKSMLFETPSADPWIFASAAAALGVIALAAAYVPARRATGVDPMIALRYE
jgi:putative ABC transport system permease protein